MASCTDAARLILILILIRPCLLFVCVQNAYSALCALLCNQPRQLYKRAAKSKSENNSKYRLDWIIQTQQGHEVNIEFNPATLLDAVPQDVILLCFSFLQIATLTLRNLVKKYSPVTFAYLKSILGEKDVFLFYEDWLWWVVELLPLDHLVRVLDCYLLEGIKVFYRVAVVLVKSFHLHSSKSLYYIL